jgi:hypothetical protein
MTNFHFNIPFILGLCQHYPMHVTIHFETIMVIIPKHSIMIVKIEVRIECMVATQIYCQL